MHMYILLHGDNMFSKYWSKVQEIVNDCNEKVRKIVKEIVETIRREYGEKIEQLSRLSLIHI